MSFILSMAVIICVLFITLGVLSLCEHLQKKRKEEDRKKEVDRQWLETLGKTVSDLKTALTDTCTYCGQMTAKGTLKETGEKKRQYCHNSWRSYEINHRACPKCLEDFHRKCLAYKTATSTRTKA